LIREPDRNGIKKAISILNGTVDLVHYDSDKSYQGRNFGYPLLWDALREGGIFISDDIQDNMAFREFVSKEGAPFAVTESQGKYVGIA
jgi:predicted O-methyltransferase YrrM